MEDIVISSDCLTLAALAPVVPASIALALSVVGCGSLIALERHLMFSCFHTKTRGSQGSNSPPISPLSPPRNATPPALTYPAYSSSSPFSFFFQV